MTLGGCFDLVAIIASRSSVFTACERLPAAISARARASRAGIKLVSDARAWDAAAFLSSIIRRRMFTFANNRAAEARVAALHSRAYAMRYALEAVRPAATP